jgi:hypothetical protein
MVGWVRGGRVGGGLACWSLFASTGGSFFAITTGRLLCPSLTITIIIILQALSMKLLYLTASIRYSSFVIISLVIVVITLI